MFKTNSKVACFVPSALGGIAKLLRVNVWLSNKMKVQIATAASQLLKHHTLKPVSRIHQIAPQICPVQAVKKLAHDCLGFVLTNAVTVREFERPKHLPVRFRKPSCQRVLLLVVIYGIHFFSSFLLA
jgi:hypothetical protein